MVRATRIRSPGSARQLVATLTPASGEDGATGTGPHPEPEAMGAAAAPITRLEGALAHGRSPTFLEFRSSGPIHAGQEMFGRARGDLLTVRGPLNRVKCARVQAQPDRLLGAAAETNPLTTAGPRATAADDDPLVGPDRATEQGTGAANKPTRRCWSGFLPSWVAEPRATLLASRLASTSSPSERLRNSIGATDRTPSGRSIESSRRQPTGCG